MKTVSIDHLVYAIKKSGSSLSGDMSVQNSGAIFFLGAGMSKPGGIPLAGEIAETIKIDYKDNPFIRELNDRENDYAKLMNGLLPLERNTLLKRYVDNAKINTGYLYLANLLKNNFADYILTVNFDNLMQRAATLLHFYPATYDMAILKDLTTTNFHKQSIIHLHGHFQGPWLLNTKDEMDKVKDVLPKIFDTIKHNRPWVFIGYSGNDPVFEHLINMGRFDNGLYWVGYKDVPPSKNVQDFLSNPHTNGFLIKGYDADTFMTELNSKLINTEPLIWEKPFTYLKQTITQINETNDDVGYLKNDISGSQVELAIKIFGENYDDVSKFLLDNHGNIENYIKESIFRNEYKRLYYSKRFNEDTVNELVKSAVDLNTDTANFMKVNVKCMLVNSIVMSINLEDDILQIEQKIARIDELLDEAISYGKSNFYYYTKVRALNMIILTFNYLENKTKCIEYLGKYEATFNQLEESLTGSEIAVKSQIESIRLELAGIYELFITSEPNFLEYFDKAMRHFDEIHDIDNLHTGIEVQFDLIEAVLERVDVEQKVEYYDMAINLGDLLIRITPDSYKGYFQKAIMLLRKDHDDEILNTNFLLHQSFHFLKIAEELGCGNLEIATYYEELGYYETSANYLNKGLREKEFDLEDLDNEKWMKVLAYLQ